MRALKRLGGIALVLWASATVTFFSMRLIPGDPALAVLGGPGTQASAEALAAARAEYGFDQPLIVQYFMQLGRYLSGQLGQSSSLRMPVSDVIAQQLPATLTLSLAALVLGWLLALGLASVSATGSGFATRLTSGLEIVSAALPHFWLGALLVFIFANTLRLLPAAGGNDLIGLIMPTITLALPLAGFLGQIMRGPAEEALTQPFALSAAARGGHPLGIFYRHTLRHAAAPAISLTGWAFGSLISGAVVVESVFARPGIGRVLLRAVQERDIALVSGITLVAAAAYCVAMLVSDVLEALVDPRLGPKKAVGRVG